MAKCGPRKSAAPKKKAPPKTQKAKCGHKRKGHPANMFILYFLETYRRCGGNMYCVAKECGKRWKTLPQSEKDKYKRQYCSRCKNCKSCQRKVDKNKGGAGGKRKC